ncbi:MAG: hypothetical protein U5R49_21970 [Deltaproteobacteria bacterium]|nr:hypothetical protein [Deltaproteobacteria bacterium]
MKAIFALKAHLWPFFVGHGTGSEMLFNSISQEVVKKTFNGAQEQAAINRKKAPRKRFRFTMINNTNTLLKCWKNIILIFQIFSLCL